MQDTARIQPLSYVEIWDAYCAGMFSTRRLAALLREDEVFRAFCMKRVAGIRKRVEETNKAAEEA